MAGTHKLPAHVLAAASKPSPKLLHEIFYGFGLGVFSLVGLCRLYGLVNPEDENGASFWKMHHMNERRKTEEFYAKLEAGEITVSADE